MRHKRRKINEKLAVFLIILTTLIIGGAIAVNILITKHYAEISKSESEKLSAYVISSCVEKVLKDQTGELLRITCDDSGKITALEADSAEINSLQKTLLKEINNALGDKESFSAEIPIGTLVENSLLAGRGPAVTLQFDQKGSAKVTLKNEFVSGGINQTVHRLYAHIETRVFCISPFESEPVLLSFDYLISETVIVGEVPQNFFSQIGN